MVKLFCRYRSSAPLPHCHRHRHLPHNTPPSPSNTRTHTHTLRGTRQETNTGIRLPSATSHDPTEGILTPELEPLPSVRAEQSNTYIQARALCVSLCVCLSLSFSLLRNSHSLWARGRDVDHRALERHFHSQRDHERRDTENSARLTGLPDYSYCFNHLLFNI